MLSLVLNCGIHNFAFVDASISSLAHGSFSRAASRFHPNEYSVVRIIGGGRSIAAATTIISPQTSIHGVLLPILRGGSTSTTWKNSSPLGSRTAPRLQRPPAQQQQSSAFKQRQEQEGQQKQDAKEVMDAFLTRDSRTSFISRVYAILATQLTVTSLVIFWFGTHPGVAQWMRRPGSFGTAVPWLSLLLSTICWFGMAASADLRRRSPVKWQLLALFTIGEALSVGFISSFYTFSSVLSAMMATAVGAGAVSWYTATQRNPKYDLSQWGATLSSCGLIFLTYGFLQLLQIVGILPAGFLPLNDMIYGLFGACLFSVYLAYHTKLIVGGKHTKYQMSEKDYVFGAMTLYNDIINMFIYVLRLLGEDRDNH